MRKAISQKVSVGEQQARELGFPVQDEKLRVFLKVSKTKSCSEQPEKKRSLTPSAREKARGASVWLQ